MGIATFVLRTILNIRLWQLWAAVSNSIPDLWKPPSPITAATDFRGSASCAPMATGELNPMDWKSVGTINPRGARTQK